MAIERRNPLPLGRYWVDVFDPHIADFRVWLSNHEDSIKVEKQENYLPRDTYPAHNWYLFTVTKETPWEGPGLPTIAEQEIHASEDTAQKPPPEPSGLDQIEAGIEKAGNFLLIGALVGAAYVGYRILK